MCSPHSDRPLRGEAPYDDPALGIAGDQATIVPDESRGMDLRCMPAQDICRLSWRQSHHDGAFKS